MSILRLDTIACLNEQSNRKFRTLHGDRLASTYKTALINHGLGLRLPWDQVHLSPLQERRSLPGDASSLAPSIVRRRLLDQSSATLTMVRASSWELYEKAPLY